MCGIHFTISNDTFLLRGEDYFKDAFVTNQLRGMHSSGMYVVEKDGTILTHKAAVCGQEFIKDKDAIPLLTKVGRARVAVGHVRHATMGKISDENAHPFVIDREDGTQLVGVHNGTLRNWKLKEGSNDVDVDSEWAFTKLAEYGSEAFKFFDGAYAFVWYDTATPDVVYMARNSERPLHYMVSKDKKSLIGASELGMLGWLTERNKIEGATDPKDRFKYLEAGKIYAINLKDPMQATVEDAPKYDPTTSRFSQVPTAHGQSSLMYPTTHYNSLQNEGYGYYGEGEDEGLPFPRRNTHHVPLHYERNAEAATTQILKEVSDALRVARNAKPGDNAASEESTELKEITDEVFRQKVDLPAAQVDTTLFLANPTTATATKVEIEACQNRRLYGAVVEFSGVMYDEELSACIGNVKIFHSGRWFDEDAELRGISKGYAHHRYIDPISPKQLAVVGWNANEGGGTPAYYVLAEMTETQKKMIELRSRKMTAH